MEYYNLLNLPFDATPEEIRAAYFEAARKYHPDASNGMVDGKLFMSIQKAYDILSDTNKRKAYDETIPDAVKDKSEISIETIYSRSNLENINSSQLLYVLLNIKSTKNIDLDDRPPAHLCLILDRSTSMNGDRMEMVKKNMGELIRWLRNEDVISVITFSDRAEVVIEPTECNDANQIIAKLNGIKTSGATEIYQGLELGFDLFKRSAGKSNHARHLILVTDGHTYGDEEKCYHLAERANTEGIIINAIGIGDEWNDKFLDTLARTSGGNAVYIQNDLDLKHFIARKVNAMNANLARKAEIHLDFPENVKLLYVFRNQPDVSPLDVKSPIQAGPVEYNGMTSVMFEFKIEGITDTAKFIKIAVGKVLLDVITKPIPTERYFVNFELPLSETPNKETVPPEILNAISKISLYRLQEKAREEVHAGNIAKATKHLKYLATRLMSQGETKLAGHTLAEAEHLQMHGSYSKEGDKIIKYGTRSLFMLPDPELNDYD